MVLTALASLPRSPVWSPRSAGNITDLTTRLAGELYVLIAEVDLPSTVDM